MAEMKGTTRYSVSPDATKMPTSGGPKKGNRPTGQAGWVIGGFHLPVVPPIPCHGCTPTFVLHFFAGSSALRLYNFKTRETVKRVALELPGSFFAVIQHSPPIFVLSEVAVERLMVWTQWFSLPASGQGPSLTDPMWPAPAATTVNNGGDTAATPRRK